MENKLTKQQVYEIIDTEREYQDQLSSNRTDGREHPVADFLVMLNYYLQKANEAWTMNSGDEKSLEVIRKIAGITVHCMEKHGAKKRTY